LPRQPYLLELRRKSVPKNVPLPTVAENPHLPGNVPGRPQSLLDVIVANHSPSETPIHSPPVAPLMGSRPISNTTTNDSVASSSFSGAAAGGRGINSTRIGAQSLSSTTSAPALHAYSQASSAGSASQAFSASRATLPLARTPSPIQRKSTSLVSLSALPPRGLATESFAASTLNTAPAAASLTGIRSESGKITGRLVGSDPLSRSLPAGATVLLAASAAATSSERLRSMNASLLANASVGALSSGAPRAAVNGHMFISNARAGMQPPIDGQTPTTPQSSSSSAVAATPMSSHPTVTSVLRPTSLAGSSLGAGSLGSSGSSLSKQHHVTSSALLSVPGRHQWQETLGRRA